MFKHERNSLSRFKRGSYWTVETGTISYSFKNIKYSSLNMIFNAVYNDF